MKEFFLQWQQEIQHFNSLCQTMLEELWLVLQQELCFIRFSLPGTK